MSFKVKFLYQIIILAIFCLPITSTGFITNLGFWRTSSGGGITSTNGYTFTADAFNVDILSVLTANKVAIGWDGVSAAAFNVTINAGVTIGSVDPTSAALVVSNNFPPGSTITITNNGTIIGAGGNAGSGSGGDGIWLNYPVTLINNGTISGGGGGGGNGNSGCGTAGSAGGPGAGVLATATATATRGADGNGVGVIAGGAGSNTGAGAIGNSFTQAGNPFGGCYWDDGYGNTGYYNDVYGSGGGGGAPGYSGGAGGNNGASAGVPGWALIGSAGIVNAGWASTGTYKGNNTTGANAARTYGKPLTIEAFSGNNQSSNILVPFVAVVKDYSGQLLSNIQVNWSKNSGNGSLTIPTSFTDVNGQSPTSFTPNTTGAASITAAINATSIATNFNATVLVGDCTAATTPGTFCAGGAIYLGSLSPGATSGSGTDRYMTTPGGCGEIPAGQKVNTGSGYSSYPNADFTPSCSGQDFLYKNYDNGAWTPYDIPSLANYTTTSGAGNGAINIDANYGSTNTANLAAITAPAEGGYFASARYCDKLNFGGFTDWHLPNRYELNLMFTNKASIHGLNLSSWYWASTEYSNYNAWGQRPSDGHQTTLWKSQTAIVRCVRRY